jgi:uncharacterized membrane protein
LQDKGTGVVDALAGIMGPWDSVALAVFLLSMFGYRLATGGRSPLARNSLIGAIQRQRVAWMLNMSRRDNRNMDVILLSSLGQGNAFFASTTAIVIGGLAALLGSGERAQQILERLPLVARSSGVLWEIKLLLIMAIFVFAFFKFAWAFRLSHYAQILIGATPILTADNVHVCDSHAERTAALAGLSAEHANAGLRSFYYAFAALAWFFHPAAFMAANFWVLLILMRRDFFSRSLRLIAGAPVVTPTAVAVPTKPTTDL